MFEHTADLYDAFYDALEKDYDDEARTVIRLVKRVMSTNRSAKPRTLLDVACGTGRHLEAFAKARPGLRCMGVDIDEQMLAVAAERNPGMRLIHADMADLDLGDLGDLDDLDEPNTFDVVTCLFSSIAYSPTVKALRRATKRMADHLARPHGVLVVEPWFTPDEWAVGHVAILTVDTERTKAARISRSSRRKDMSILDFDYLIADTRENTTRHVTERHELRLFTWDQYVHAFEAAGLVVHVDDYGLFGRGLLLGTFA